MSSENKNHRPLPLSMLFLCNIPVIPFVVTEILNKVDKRSGQIRKDQQFLLMATEAIKLLTIFYTLTTSSPAFVPAVIYFGASLAQGLTVNKVIDRERI